MNNIICQITWTEQDIIDAFSSKYSREPTAEELSECIKKLSVKDFQDRSVEFGWDFINRALCKQKE